jgi:hypothetical protein
VGYDEIKKVVFTDNIEIHAKGKVRKLPLLNMEDNEAKYEEIVGGFKSVLGYSINVNQIVKKLTKTAYKKNTGEPNKFTPLLKILLFYLITTVAGHGFYALFMPTQPNMQIMYPVTIMVTAVIFAIGMPMCIYTTNKHWRAPGLIKIYLWAHVVLSAVSHIEQFVIDAGAVPVQNYISLPVSLTLNILFAYLVGRFLDISQSAQNTFIRERLFFDVRQKSAFKKKHSVRSWWALARAALAAVILVVILPVSIIKTSLYFVTDKNIYSSVDELTAKKYGEESVLFLHEDGYYLIAALDEDAEKFYTTNLYWQDQNGYIYEMNKWHQSALGFKTDDLNYYPDLSVYVHGKNYIILMQAQDNDESVTLSDSFDVIPLTETRENNGRWYFKVIDMDEAGEDYCITLTVDGQEIYSATFKDIIED